MGTKQDYTDDIEQYRGLNSLVDRLIKTGDTQDRQTDTQTQRHTEFVES